MANKIVLELLADSNGLLKGLDRAQSQVDKFVRSSDTAGRSLGGGVNRALEAFEGLASGGAAAAGVLAGGLAAAATAAVLMTATAAKQVEQLDQLSQKTGIAIQTIQGWSVVMAENGFQAESLTAGMRTLSQQMIEARNPASAAASTFDSLGVSITALGSTEAVIRAVADKFKDMPDGADKARLAVQLFGKSGLELIPLLNRGAAAFDESRRQAERFGTVLSGSQVAALNAADDATDRLGVALSGLKTQLAITFAPAVAHGTDLLTEGIARITAAVREMREEAAHKDTLTFFDRLKSMVPGSSLMEAGVRALKGPTPPAAGGPSLGPDQNAHMDDFLRQGQAQEEQGRRIVAQLIERYKQTVAIGHAEEALGRVQLAIVQREQAERNAAFAMRMEQEEQVNTLQFEKRDSSVFDAQLKGVQALMALMPELTHQEAALLALHNQQAAQATVTAAVDAHAHRNDALDMAVEKMKVLDDAQQTLFRSEAGLFGASDAARRQRVALIDAEAERERQRIEETIFNEERKAQALANLDTQTETRRRQAVQEFPTFLEQQLQAIVQSNTFSMGQMVSTWSNGIATMIVKGGDLKAVWEQTQVAIVQAALNAAVQQAAAAALASSANTAAATASTGVWTAAAGGISAALLAIGAAAKALWFEAILPALLAVGKAIMGFLSAVAAAMKATIFGIPVGVAILAGVVAIGAALAAMGAIKFADGGIATGPTLGMIGEAGSSEAVIPLNKRGAAFMREAVGMGGGKGQVIHTHVYLDKREIALALSDEQPSALRRMGAL